MAHETLKIGSKVFLVHNKSKKKNGGRITFGKVSTFEYNSKEEDVQPVIIPVGGPRGIEINPRNYKIFTKQEEAINYLKTGK